jgi:hypothetical protein
LAHEPDLYYDSLVGGKARGLTNEQILAAPPGTLRKVPLTEYTITKEAVELGSDYMGSLAQMKDIIDGFEGLDPGAFSIQGDFATAAGRALTSVGLGSMADGLVERWTGKPTLDEKIKLDILLESWVNSNKEAILNDQRISGPDQVRLDRVIEKGRLFGSVGAVKEMVKTFQMYGLINNELALAASGRDRQFPVPMGDSATIAQTMATIRNVGGLSHREAAVWVDRMMEYRQLTAPVYSGGQRRLDENLLTGAP